MPIIKPRAVRVDTMRHIARLLETNRDALVLYAAFIRELPDYVLNRLIETTIAKDREYLDWRAAHPEITAATILASTRRRRPSTPRAASEASSTSPSPAPAASPAGTMNAATPSARS